MENNGNEVVTSKKQSFLERQRQRFPDMNLEDEEALFAKINEDYDSYDARLKANDEENARIADLFNRDSRSTAFLLDWRDGKDPVIALIEKFGDDFREALDNPEMLEKFAEANKKHNEKLLLSEKLNKESEENLDASLDALDEAQKESEVDDEVAKSAFELYNAVINDGIINKVSKETWGLFIKAVCYDQAVADAAHEGEVRGRNSTIDMQKKKLYDKTMPPSIGGQGTAPDTEKRSYGALDRYAENSEDVWERGGGIRRR